MKKLIITTVAVLSLSLSANAQRINNSKEEDRTHNYLMDLNRHEFRTFYSTAYPGSLSDAFAFGLADALAGNEKTETSTFGMVGIGYRYQINRFIQLGLDFGYSKAKENVYKSKNDKVASKKSNIFRLLAIPTIDFKYWESNNNLVNIYGSAGVGALFTKRKETTDPQAKSLRTTEFAYQVNPIGVRIGNDRIGGFVEAGYGNKGLITAGVSVKF